MTRPSARSRATRSLVACLVLATAISTGVAPVAATTTAEPATAVLDWNLNAVNALSNPTVVTPPTAPGAAMPPPVASIYLAMVHGAMYDAVNAIDRGHKPYLHGLPRAPRNASKSAAAATAAHHVLVGVEPTLPAAVDADLDARYAASLALIPPGQAKTDGIAIGAAVAQAMLDERADDGRFGPFRFTEGTDPGEWRAVLPGFVSDPFAWVAKVEPFTLKRNSQFRTRGPLDMTSQRYVSEFNEVRAFGAATGSARTVLQTETARFFTANPLPMQNKMLRDVAIESGLSIARAARLFALSSFSGADAFINCWDDKAHHNFWRPITAIREAADDGNPSTEPQSDWLPYIGTFVASGTPPYPDHPSGYNCYTGAMMKTAQRYFGNSDLTIQLTSPITMTTRTYDRFTDVLVDTIDARIYLGIHTRTPDLQGALLGKQVADWVAKHYLR